MPNSPQFILRWKGQQFGPFTKEIIEQKVREHELSLAHEIQVDGKWRSLRGFLSLAAQTQEQERQRVHLKQMQDDLTEKNIELDEKQSELQEVKKALEEEKKRPTVVTAPPPQAQPFFIPSSMIACLKCGMANQANARYCTVCGEELLAQHRASPHRSRAPLNDAEYAGFWARFCAAFLDLLIVTILSAGAGFVVGFSAAFSGNHWGPSAYQLLGSIVGLIVNWIYFAGMESSLRQGTLGKRAMGIIVTDLSGERVSFGRATGRHFGKIVSALILCIGFIMAAFTERKQALHDMMAECLVVRRS